MAEPRRTRTGMIPELQQRRSSFSKRRDTLLGKAHELSERTGARATVVVHSSTGKTSYCSYPSGKVITEKKTRGKGLRDWEKDWIEKECDSCTTKEDLESLIEKYKAYGVRARKRLEDWENKPSVKAGAAGGDSGVRVHWDPETLPDEEIESLLAGLTASPPSPLAPHKDSVGHGNWNSFRTSQVNSAAGGQKLRTGAHALRSWGLAMESQRLRST